MRKLFRILTVITFVGLMILPVAPTLKAQVPEQAPKTKAKKTEKPTTVRTFIRIQKDDKGKIIALQTATARYVPASGEGNLVVHLRSAIHMADLAYYNRQKKDFQKDDVVLYELVTPQGVEKMKEEEKKKKQQNPFALLVRLFLILLELEYQTDHIDPLHPPKNFVHADLSIEQMGKIIRERGDDAMTIGLSIAADALRQYNLEQRKRQSRTVRKAEVKQQDMSTLVEELREHIRNPTPLKRELAQELAKEGAVGIPFQALNQILVEDRDTAGMGTFQKELVKGKTRISFFWGAAHMPDFEKRLILDFDLKLDGVEWITAWNLRDRERTEADEYEKAGKIFLKVIMPLIEQYEQESRRKPTPP